MCRLAFRRFNYGAGISLWNLFYSLHVAGESRFNIRRDSFLVIPAANTDGESPSIKQRMRDEVCEEALNRVSPIRYTLWFIPNFTDCSSCISLSRWYEQWISLNTSHPWYHLRCHVQWYLHSSKLIFLTTTFAFIITTVLSLPYNHKQSYLTSCKHCNNFVPDIAHVSHIVHTPRIEILKIGPRNCMLYNLLVILYIYTFNQLSLKK